MGVVVVKIYIFRKSINNLATENCENNLLIPQTLFRRPNCTLHWVVPVCKQRHFPTCWSNAPDIAAVCNFQNICNTILYRRLLYKKKAKAIIFLKPDIIVSFYLCEKLCFLGRTPSLKFDTFLVKYLGMCLWTNLSLSSEWSFAL